MLFNYLDELESKEAADFTVLDKVAIWALGTVCGAGFYAGIWALYLLGE